MRRLVSVLMLSMPWLAACAGTGNPAARRAPEPRTPEQQAVLAVAERFLKCIGDHDHEAGAGITVPQGAFISIRGAAGERRLGGFTLSRWLEMLRQEDRVIGEYFSEPPVVLVDGDVAVVWGRFAFEVEGEVANTGTDAITLVRTDEGWKVAGGAYSIVPATP